MIIAQVRTDLPSIRLVSYGFSSYSANRYAERLSSAGILLSSGKAFNDSESLIFEYSDFHRLTHIINSDPFFSKLHVLTEAVNNFLSSTHAKHSFAGFSISQNDFLTMGILNTTPDSFSDGGVFFASKRAIEAALAMAEEHADIIDIGGESTRPGAESVSVKEELRRVIPVIEGIRKHNKSIVLSIDTTKSKVAEAACEAGASVVNDISGGTFDRKMIQTVAKHNASYVIMHTAGKPGIMQKNTSYKDLFCEVNEVLFKQSQKAALAGIRSIAVDPGIGFGKSFEDNFKLINNLNNFSSLGFPILIGLSRKAFIGKTLLDSTPLNIQLRDSGSLILQTAALLRGAKIIRTHAVPEAYRLKLLFRELLKT